ncbi:hypothetical protein ACFXTO_005826 [Malus domestica]|uniref:Uncharacterized protein n=1 Tax=Malus domestica TaxID=3750 RepID=A0A498ISS5_MALDO|nr:hypothetical protein DVH24_041915 [Malus domestica]
MTPRKVQREKRSPSLWAERCRLVISLSTPNYQKQIAEFESSLDLLIFIIYGNKSLHLKTSLIIPSFGLDLLTISANKCPHDLTGFHQPGPQPCPNVLVLAGKPRPQ